MLHVKQGNNNLSKHISCKMFGQKLELNINRKEKDKKGQKHKKRSTKRRTDHRAGEATISNWHREQ